MPQMGMRNRISNGAQEIELYNHGAGLAYAYVQVENRNHGDQNMEYAHSQETVIETFDYNGIDVDLISWRDTIWRGKVGYAVNNIDEPDVKKIAHEASLIFPNNIPNGRERNWEVCISLNYLSKERPNGVMFGFLVETEEQPDCYDVIKVPSSLYMKIQICDKTFKALEVEPWTGGIPPYKWIGEILAPRYGYEYGDDTLPIYEYYFHNPENFNIDACYLYVPVRPSSSRSPIRSGVMDTISRIPTSSVLPSSPIRQDPLKE